VLSESVFICIAHQSAGTKPPIVSVLRVNAVNSVRRNTNKINIIADKHADRTDTQYKRKKEVLNRNSVN